MNVTRFNKLVDDTVKQIKEVLVSKGKEYSKDENKLHNFDVGARMTGESREKVLHGMALKHHISISDIRNDAAKGKLPTIEMVNEKFGDAINYLILEKACIVDRIEKINGSIQKPVHFKRIEGHAVAVVDNRPKNPDCNSDCLVPPFQCSCDFKG